MISRDLIKLFLTLMTALLIIGSKAQNIGINATGSIPNTSAGLDVDFTNKGMLVPRVALTGTADVATIVSPATSLLVYNTATAGTAPNNVVPGFYYWSGSAWVKLATGTNTDWTTTGNAGTVPGTNFIGTTDAKDFVFKTNNDEFMRITDDGKLGINTNSPEELFHIESGAGNMLLGRNVYINSTRGTFDPDFNLIGFGGPDEISIGASTNEVNKMKLHVPLSSSFISDDGAIEFLDPTSFTPLFRLQEDHKMGINTSLPEELFHIEGGAGNMLLGRNVYINSTRGTMDPDFNLIGFGGPDEITIGASTNEVNKMKIHVPLSSSFISDDGAIEFLDPTSFTPLFRFQEDHKMGINTSLPEELFHIASGAGNMLLDRNVYLNSTRGTMDPDFNLIGFGGPDEITIGASTNEVNKMKIHVPLSSSFISDDGAIEFMDPTSFTPLFRLQEDHKVGINTTTPQELLDVQGKVRIGNYTLPDLDGTAGQVLTTNGSGVVSWATSGSGSGWGLTGNAGVNAATNFIGTTDGNDFVTRTLNTERMRVSSSGNVGIGDASPLALFTVGNGDLFQVVSTGHTRTINGTAALPSFSFTGDTDNGMYLSAANELSLSTSGTQRMTITSAGNFGFGTSAPGAKVEINGQIKITGGTPGAGKVLTSDATGLASWQTATSNNWGLTGNAGTTFGTNFIGTTDNVSLMFKTNNLERMSVTASGMVGINNGGQYFQQLTVGGGISSVDATSDNYFVVRRAGMHRWTINESATTGFQIQQAYNDAGAASFFTRFEIADNGNVGIGTSTTPGRKLTVSGSETAAHGFGACISLVNTAAGGTDWYLRAGATGTATPAGGFSIADNSGYRMVIDNAGNLGIGTTTPTQRLTVFNGTTTGTYTTTGWIHSSDSRLKTNVATLENPMEKIMKLRGVSYNWNAAPDKDKQIGFIAQEVEKVVPEVVVVDSEGNYGMAYQNLNALIIEGMKEQQSQIEELKKQNEMLMKELQEIRNSLNLTKAEK